MIHFIGITGTGMSGLAYYLASSGARISGSDLIYDEATDRRLKALGARLFYKHAAKNVPADCELVVKSAAVRDDNPEIKRAKHLRIPVIKYAELLGRLMADKPCGGIAVSGSHGKTTTSSLIAYLLRKAGSKPSFVIGGVIPAFNTNAHYGRGRYFVAEACEYDRSFHHLDAQIKIITNIEPDHLDYYGTMAALVKAFEVFANSLPADGTLIANIDSPVVAKMIPRLRCGHVITYGLNRKADWTARNIKVKNGAWHFEAWHNSKKYGNFTMGVAGEHNVVNSLAAIAVADLLGINKNSIKNAVHGFKGAARRFQVIGEFKGVTVIDDYGHHPTELNSVIKTARLILPGRRLWMVFQPHQYSRTRYFLNEFADVLSGADAVLVPPIYECRDSAVERKKVSAVDLVEAINRRKQCAKYMETFDTAADYLQYNTISGDVVITIGAGDVWKVGRDLITELKKK
ncbi:MAG: UDP-N-acetylmuramate--L-alanine ligase [Planctomycetes bacterium]|nr:UDP-N-acetylmuramate--L-alanine ligase [Planctomycetota bacterium]